MLLFVGVRVHEYVVVHMCVCVYRCQGLCMFAWNATDVDGWLAGRDDRRMYMCVCVCVST